MSLGLACLTSNISLKTRVIIFSSALRRATARHSLIGWLVGFVSYLVSLPGSGLAVLEPPSGLDVLRRGVNVEGAFAALLELVGAFSTERLVLVYKRGHFWSKGHHSGWSVGGEGKELDDRRNKPTGDLSIGGDLAPGLLKFDCRDFYQSRQAIKKTRNCKVVQQ